MQNQSEFIKPKTICDDKLKNINNRDTLYFKWIKHQLVENELIELSENVKLLSAKGYIFC